MAKRAKKTTRKKTSVWAQVWAFCVAAWGFCAKTLPKTLPFLPIVIVLAAAFWFFHLTKTDYLAKPNSQGNEASFLVAPGDIVITGCSSPETEQFVREIYLAGIFGLTEPVNGYDLMQQPIVERLRQSPYFSGARMIYYPKQGKVELHVQERVPIARLPSGLYVDIWGVCFRPSAPAPGRLPAVSGWDGIAHYVPGSRIPTEYRCMLRIIDATKVGGAVPFPTVSEISLRPGAYSVEDGVEVRLADGREIILAWNGMGMDTDAVDEAIRTTERKAMLERLRKVAKVLAAPDLSGKRRINAQTDNITVSD